VSRHWKIGVLIMALAATAPRASSAETAPADWLVTPVHTPVTLAHGGGGREIILSNGLMSRTFRIAPNAATVSLRNLTTGSEMVRGVKPEATITLDGQLFDVGGLNGQKEYGYLLPEWLDSMTSDPGAFQFTGYDTDDRPVCLAAEAISRGSALAAERAAAHPPLRGSCSSGSLSRRFSGREL